MPLALGPGDMCSRGLAPIFGDAMASIHGGKPLDPRRKGPGPALKAPDVARRSTVGPPIAESSAKPFRAEPKRLPDFLEIFARHVSSILALARSPGAKIRGCLIDDKNDTAENGTLRKPQIESASCCRVLPISASIHKPFGVS